MKRYAFVFDYDGGLFYIRMVNSQNISTAQRMVGTIVSTI